MTVGKVRGIWKNTSTANRIIAVSATVSALSTLCYALITLLMLSHLTTQTKSSIIAANAAKSAADTASKNMDLMKSSGDETKHQVDRLIAQQQRTADAMEGSLQRSKAALDASIAIAHNEQRAWIVIPSKYGVFDIVANGPITYSIAFLNTGKSPADSVEAIVRGEVLTAGKEPSLTYESGTSNEFHVGELVPNDDEPRKLEVRAAHSSVILTQYQVERIRAGMDYIAFYGEASYRDLAGMHWMRFCKGTPLDIPLAEKAITPMTCAAYNSSGNGRIPPRRSK